MPLQFGTLAQRPASGAVAGDPYIATDTHQNFIWSGTEWVTTENFTQTEHDALAHSASLLAVETPLGKYLKDDGTWGTIAGGGDMTKAVYDPAAKNAQLAAVTDLHANTNDPTADQKAALAGTSGTPSITNKFVTNADTRNSDARTPTSHSHSENILHSLATAINDFLVASGSGAFVKKTLVETLTILGKAAASGLASLNASSKVVEQPASISDHLGTTPSTQAFGDAAAGGSATTASKNDHKHAMMSDPVPSHAALTTTAHGGLLPSTAFSGLAKITVGITAPTTPNTGDLWVDTS